MDKIKIRIRSSEEMWTKDKELLEKKYQDVPIDWESPEPTNGDADAIRTRVIDLWFHPHNPIELNNDVVEEHVGQQLALLKPRWNYELQARPEIEIVSPENYLPRLQELLAEKSAAIKYPIQIQSPPSMMHDPYHGKIIIPRMFPFRVTRAQEDVYKMEQEPLSVRYFPWNKDFFAFALNEELSHSIYRQIRGEWKEDYAKVFHTVGVDTIGRTVVSNELLALIAKEQIARTARPEWGIYTALDKVNEVWCSSNHFNAYNVFAGTVNATSLKRVASLENIFFDITGASPIFDERHPNHGAKRKLFYGE